MLLGSCTAAAVVWWVYLLGAGTGPSSVLGAERIALELAVATSFFSLPRRRIEPLLERVGGWCRQRPGTALAGLVAGVYGAAWLTTPQINYGAGAEGLGYGDDGAYYGFMTEHFTWFGTKAYAPFSFRPLVPFLVHASGLSTFTGYRILNGASSVLSGLLIYGIARRYTREPGRALVGVALFLFLKYGPKFWIYYPVLTDGLGTVLLLAGILATIAGHRLAYVVVMALGVFCRENLLVLIGFNVLHALRTGRSRSAVLSSLALQAVPIGLFVVSRVKPVFPPLGATDDFGVAFNFLRRFLFSFDWQFRAGVAHLNALGVLLVLALLNARRMVAFLRADYEWAYYLAAVLLLLPIGGTDLDRFAYWHAPLLVVTLVRLPWAATWDAWFWSHVLALQAIAMDLFLRWQPQREFYLALFAAHARDASFLYLEASAVLTMAIVAAMLHATRRGRPA